MIHSKNSEKKTKQKTNQNEIAIDKVVVSVGVWHRRISYQAKVNHEVSLSNNRSYARLLL